MQHRIELSTDLLIAVRGKENYPRNMFPESGTENGAARENYRDAVTLFTEEEILPALYGIEHARAV